MTRRSINDLGALVIGACMLAAGAWHGAGAVRPADEPPAPTAPRDIEARPSAAQQNPVDLARLSNWHLFGEAPPQPAAPVEQPVAETPPEFDAEALTETALPLRLEGVLLAREESATRIIIAPTNGAAQEYKVGDALPGNATLHGVLGPQRVVIKRKDGFEALSLPFQTDLTGDPRTALQNRNAARAEAQRRQALRASVASRNAP